jgi:hypothetical protein
MTARTSTSYQILQNKTATSDSQTGGLKNNLIHSSLLQVTNDHESIHSGGGKGGIGKVAHLKTLYLHKI